MTHDPIPVVMLALQSQPLAGNPTVASPLQGARVLVADDSPIVRAALRRVLEHAGARVHEVDDGEGIVAAAAALQPDCILLDLGMPRIDGLVACRLLRAEPATRALPICVVTARDDDGTHLLALEAGAEDFVPKPARPELLRQRVANLVARRRTERENERLVRELGRYVSGAAFAHSARSAGAQGSTGVERLSATVLFSDLRGFTATSHGQPGEEVFAAVSAVMAAQAAIVEAAGGYVDKFAGDGMLAVFTGPDGASEACLAARRIIEWARTWHGARFWDPPPVALGLHCGEVLRGELGGTTRSEYTVIGRNVNIAARLCGAAGRLEALVSEDVARRARDRYTFGLSRSIALKGLPEPIRVRPLVGHLAQGSTAVG